MTDRQFRDSKGRVRVERFIDGTEDPAEIVPTNDTVVAVKFETEIEKLNQRIEEQAWERPGAMLLMTHPGVGPVTALATNAFLGVTHPCTA